MDPVFVQGLREAKALLDEGILTQQEFDEEKQRLKAVRKTRNETSRQGEEFRHEASFFPCTSPPPLQEEDDPAGRVLGVTDDLPSTVVATKETGLFQIQGKDAVQVLQDLREIQNVIQAFKNSGSPEAYLEWASDKGFKDITLAAPGAYFSMKTFLIDRLNLWLEEVTPQLKGDHLQLRLTRKEVNDEINHIYWAGAKMRAHFNRLPKELQRRMRDGEIRSFEQIYDYIASGKFD